MATTTITTTFGPFQQAANIWKQFAKENVPSARDIKLDGQLGADWTDAFMHMYADDRILGSFDFGALREVREKVRPLIGRWGFVGSLGRGGGSHFEFIGLVRALAQTEADRKLRHWDYWPLRDELDRHGVLYVFGDRSQLTKWVRFPQSQ